MGVKRRMAKASFPIHQQTPAYVRALIPSYESSSAGKTLIKVGPNEFAETGQLGVQTKM